MFFFVVLLCYISVRNLFWLFIVSSSRNCMLILCQLELHFEAKWMSSNSSMHMMFTHQGFGFRGIRIEEIEEIEDGQQWVLQRKWCFLKQGSGFTLGWILVPLAQDLRSLTRKELFVRKERGSIRSLRYASTEVTNHDDNLKFCLYLWGNQVKFCFQFTDGWAKLSLYEHI